MELTAQYIADFLGGTVEGNKNEQIHGISKIEEGAKGTLSFLANPKYAQYIYTTQASIVIVNSDFTPEKEFSCTLIRVENAYEAIANLLQQFNQASAPIGIEEPAFIHKTAQIGENIYIGAFAYIGENAKIGNNTKIFPNVYIGPNTTIGNDCTIYPGVAVYYNCYIGNNCIIHSGAVIGSDGFGFAPKSEKIYEKIPQIGNVILEDCVEIGSNTTIDRATIGSTIIREGVKLDNLIQIAHNVDIGKHTVIAAQTGISGSTKLGKECMIGGQVGIVGHVSLADGIKIAAQSGVSNNIKKDGTVLQGSPAYDIRDYQKSYVIFRRLPELNTNINSLEKRITELQKELQELKKTK